MELLINGANILYLGSYAVRDILWLRILTVIAASILIVYFWLLPDPLYTAIYWNLLFTAINIYWVVRLAMERRPVTLTGNDLRLYQLVFRCLTPREMRALIKLGSWHSASPGTCFVHQGDELDRLIVICSGQVDVNDGKTTERLTDGQFIGGVSFISEGVAPADVIAVEQTWYMCWPKHELKGFLGRQPELNSALHLTLGYDLVKRLEAIKA